MPIKPKRIFEMILDVGLFIFGAIVFGYIFELVNRTDRFSRPTSIGSDVIGAVYFFACAGFLISFFLANWVSSKKIYKLFSIIYLGLFFSFLLLHLLGYVRDFSS